MQGEYEEVWGTTRQNGDREAVEPLNALRFGEGSFYVHSLYHVNLFGLEKDSSYLPTTMQTSRLTRTLIFTSYTQMAE